MSARPTAPRTRWIAAAQTFVVVCFAGLLQLVTNVSPPSDYILVSWKWDYSLGVMKRALPGEVIGRVLSRTPDSVLELSIGLFAVYLALYAVYAAVVVYRRPCIGTFLLALSGVLLAPALPSFASSLGRLDQLNFAVLVCCLLMLLLNNGMVTALVVSALGTVGVLIHESFVLTSLPLICALHLTKFSGRPPAVWGKLVILVAGPMLALAGLSRYAPPLSLEGWVAYWSSRDPIIPHSGLDQVSAQKNHFRSLADNVFGLVEYVQVHRFGLVCGLVLAAAVIFLAFELFGGRRKYRLILLSCLAPLGMFALGIDFMRWVSLVVINVILGMLAIFYLKGLPAGHALSYYVPLSWRPVLAGLVLLFLAFPISSGEEWPHFAPQGSCLYAALFHHAAIGQRCGPTFQGPDQLR